MLISAERQSHTRSAAEIDAQQLALLQNHLTYLQKASPYYQELFQRCNFLAAEFASLADLAQLPLTSKADLGEFNRKFLAVPEQQVVDICQTSGTTGEPVTIWQTDSDLERLARNEQIAFTAAGIVSSDRVLIGAALDRVFMAGLAYFLGLRRIGATAIRAGSGQPALVAELIRQQRPNVLVGVPSLLLMIAQQFRESGEDPAELGIEKVICIGEPVRNDDLSLSPLGETLQQSWSAQILGTYASTELATAFADCPAGCGGHLLPELVVVEIINDQGSPVAAGEAGEVVVTPLGVEGTPLLRYRTGDIARLHVEPCLCGRQTPRLGPILGRRTQMLKCRGTTLFPAAISRVLQGISAIHGHYLEVSSDFDLSDQLRVVVGCRDASLNAATIAELIAAKTRVKPEVVLVTPEEIKSKTIRPDMRKPVTFFDHRKR
ncbi:phenylacetate-CoA ligase [Desulfuromusa kysingii]|uniref:Phenylacetate-CoA ligase n=1 Tax=Desulfuromusa kysingii TaxID=37625 RepID=A0A1H3VNY3_9BACT|nr:AMP-binding protein [Desulfuromusa kysingii]SDZ76480.1 phenylacetate-CoA ligase [Desulfuromusa kysingii]